MKKYLLFSLVLALGGCLADDINTPQREYRPVYQPPAAYFRAVTNSSPTALEIRWNPPQADTQKNFKGYFIQLFSTILDSNSIEFGYDLTLGRPEIDSVHVPKSDTMYTFIGKVVQGGRYTVCIYGERFNDNPDSVVLSTQAFCFSFYYDQLPVKPPTAIYASSAGQTSVNLFWSPSPSANNPNSPGFAGYLIRYKATDSRVAITQQVIMQKLPTTMVGSLITQPGIAVAADTGFGHFEKEYEFWIKTVRNDSTESDDSITIRWSGAERLPPTTAAIKFDSGMYLGPVNQTYNLVQTNPNSPNFTTYIIISRSGGNVVLTTQNNNTMFASKVDRRDSLELDKMYYSAPFSSSDFSSTNVNFPASGNPVEGTIIYGLFPGTNDRARILFKADSTGSYFWPDSTAHVQSSFQPYDPIKKLPYF